LNQKKSDSKKVTKKVFIYILLISFGLMFLMPFVFLISTSLKSDIEAFSPNFTIIPKEIKWDNYAKAFKEIPYLTYTKNTLIITMSCVAGELISCPLVAYALSKVNWIGKKPIFALLLATMLIPYQVTMIPLYMIWNKLGLLGTKWPLIIPSFFGGAYYIIILTQFFKTIPNSLLEAARIDGASEFKIYRSIMLPLSKPALATIGIFTFLANWSDFLGPLLYLSDQSQWTLSLGLQQFMSAHSVKWGLLMAASAMFTIPTVIIFFFAQRYFIEGIVTTGLK